MKINFTKKEYQALVEMLLVADLVIHGHDVEEHEEKKPYTALRKKVLSHHEEMGMDEEFEYSPQDDEYFETAAYEEDAPHTRFINEYDEQMFWSELASRLARRDLAAEGMLSAEGSLSEEEWATKLFEITAHYEDELAENGLNNVRVALETPRMH